VLVGYEPPAGLPAVEEGEAESRQDESVPAVIENGAEPPTGPRSSPAMTSMFVCARMSGVQLKPVPLLSVLIFWTGMSNESPPGITPLNVTVLKLFLEG
jgi:hypothetical protein